MGVTGLWTVVQPCARPIKIETLNKKRLAVDASIWIYQFLKAVRDKEGNALRNSHVVGFFRRICKLLFFGIKPVFVFDGGAPALKRQTIAGRKKRREGRREDAVRTAGKLLALQMQRRAEEEDRKRREEAQHPGAVDEEEPLPENLVYAEEITMTPQERQQNRKFKKKDAYHLPELDVPLAEMGAPNDPRIMSLEELEQYARQFESGENINVYDFSKIDFDSIFFQSLPDSDRYNILNAARLRSRLRMGYSKEQLDNMFPDRMAFSKFQIERVRERNELTQRLMHINGMSDDAVLGRGGRVAGEKGREYVLIKNDGAEGGWALGVVTTKDEGQRNKPIDVDKVEGKHVDNEDVDWEEEDEFEDVPIEGLNRIRKASPPKEQSSMAKELARRRQAVYQSRRKLSPKRRPRISKLANEDPDSLFLGQDEDDAGPEWQDVDVDGTDALFEDQGYIDQEDEDLQRAIQMSLERDQPASEPLSDKDEEDDVLEVFQQSRVEDAKPFSRGSGLTIARMANARSSKVAIQPFAASDSEEDDMDLQAALAESRKSKRRPSPTRKPAEETMKLPIPVVKPQGDDNFPGFDGPLPFEKLDLGSSLLGNKKMQKIDEDSAGGFERDMGAPEKKQAADLPPWFAGERDIVDELAAQKAREGQERERARQAREEFLFEQPARLKKQDTHEVIDLEAEAPKGSSKEIITVDSSEDEEMEDAITIDTELRMGDLADKVRAEPPQPVTEVMSESQPKPKPLTTKAGPFQEESYDEPLEWEESDRETEKQTFTTTGKPADPVGGHIHPSKSPSPELEDVLIGQDKSAPLQKEASKSPSPEFEDVVIDKRQPPAPELLDINVDAIEDEDEQASVPVSGLANQDRALLDLDSDEEIYSDPEDAALFAQLAEEAEEHARFASSLNNKTNGVAATLSAADYERELKQLRNQQKKDRRDADEVTSTMITECQQLLTLFGLPYITAPMEAEAQCAELVNLGLVDGIVTDDSDTFLFGGTRVYKNMFNAAKFVECYLASDLESSFSLTRDNLIEIAQLLGSDYTEGLPGIGPVTALEILSEFGTLEAFRDWWRDVQSGARPVSADSSIPFRRKFRRAHATKLWLPPSFPDPRVSEAYLHPEVDSDTSPFAWGVPDLDALRDFLMRTIGWSQERTDEVLVPVIRDMNRREREGTQSNITRFFEGRVGSGTAAPATAFAPRERAKGKSKRLASALGKMAERGGTAPGITSATDVVAGEDGESSRNGTGRSKRKKVASSARAATSTTEASDEEDDAEYTESRKKAKKGTSMRGKGRTRAPIKATINDSASASTQG